MPNFIDDPVTLAGAKSDLVPLGAGDPAKHVTAANWNEFRQAFLDIRARMLELTGIYLTIDDAANTYAPSTTIGAGALFGDGPDAAVVWDGSTTILGMAPVANVYTMTRDVYASGSTVNTGVTVDTAGWRYFDNGTLTLSGTGKISRNGGAGGSATGATPGTAGTAARGTTTLLATSVAGVAGGGIGSAAANCPRGFVAGAAVGGGAVAAGQSGSTGASGSIGQGGAGGGAGGHPSGAGLSGSSGGTVTLQGANLGGDLHDLRVATAGVALRSTAQITSGTSGGGGLQGASSGSGTVGGGGGSGAPGGYTVVCARAFAGTGRIESVGGNGGNGGNATGTCGGGGTGGGGSGGIAVVIAGVAPLPTISVAGGAGGTVVGAGGAGAGSGGFGGAGGAGIAITYVCS